MNLAPEVCEYIVDLGPLYKVCTNLSNWSANLKLSHQIYTDIGPQTQAQTPSVIKNNPFLIKHNHSILEHNLL